MRDCKKRSYEIILDKNQKSVIRNGIFLRKIDARGLRASEQASHAHAVRGTTPVAHPAAAPVSTLRRSARIQELESSAALSAVKKVRFSQGALNRYRVDAPTASCLIQPTEAIPT